ncbi:MAG: hypothetical protein RL885_14360 [Planctomycetota bacterium]
MKRRVDRVLGLVIALSIAVVAGCEAPSQGVPPQPTRMDDSQVRDRVHGLEAQVQELSTKNQRLDELLESQKQDQRRMQSALASLRSELQDEITRRIAAEKRESVLKDRFLAARLEAIELQTKLYEIQLPGGETAESGKK